MYVITSKVSSGCEPPPVTHGPGRLLLFLQGLICEYSTGIRTARYVLSAPLGPVHTVIMTKKLPTRTEEQNCNFLSYNGKFHEDCLFENNALEQVWMPGLRRVSLLPAAC